MKSYFKLCTEFYELDKPFPPPDALAFYRHFASEAQGPILEPMCGTGRFLIPLAQEGYAIDGVDASPHMLRVCQDKARSLGLKPDLRLQFLHHLDLPSKYRLAFVAAGSFNLIVDLEEVKESLKRLHSVLLPGGRFLIETARSKHLESSSWPWGGQWVDRPDGARIVISWLGSYDASTGISKNIHRYELIKEGNHLETEFEEFNTRAYSEEELFGLAKAAGFVYEQSYKAFEHRTPDAGDEVAVYCFRAP